MRLRSGGYATGPKPSRIHFCGNVRSRSILDTRIQCRVVSFGRSHISKCNCSSTSSSNSGNQCKISYSTPVNRPSELRTSTISQPRRLQRNDDEHKSFEFHEECHNPKRAYYGNLTLVNVTSFATQTLEEKFS